ncbi:DUF2752 domain-containing protein [Butyrivibrio sp. XPD2006]|uniref:DUF2752 domain-containing protein n=1 Tax=Butyrivibrio sp. XPD2006 TaxID=1280668 RepID=UPI0003B48338|nr:DUF2752 domain-containing protein [Butyrivibrio sp. XPD2006]
MLKTVIKRILDDLYQNKTPIIALFILWAITELIFHRFCPVVIMFGFPCPGCGLTRALFELITLHPIRALEFNPSYPLWVALAVAFFIRRYVQGKSVSVLRHPVIAVCLITIGIYIWRMTHVFPGKEPMVYFHSNVFARLIPFYDSVVTRFIR